MRMQVDTLTRDRDLLPAREDSPTRLAPSGDGCWAEILLPGNRCPPGGEGSLRCAGDRKGFYRSECNWTLILEQPFLYSNPARQVRADEAMHWQSPEIANTAVFWCMNAVREYPPGIRKSRSGSRRCRWFHSDSPEP